MAKTFYTIGETAELLGLNVSMVRYWSNEFPRFVKPERNAKGNRLYRESDIEALKRIDYLVNVRKMTLEGARKALGAERTSVDREGRVLEALKDIREQLVEVRKSL